MYMYIIDNRSASSPNFGCYYLSDRNRNEKPHRYFAGRHYARQIDFDFAHDAPVIVSYDNGIDVSVQFV